MNLSGLHRVHMISIPTTQLCHYSSHKQYLSNWARLCASKTLCVVTGAWLIPSLESRASSFGVCGSECFGEELEDH